MAVTIGGQIKTASPDELPQLQTMTVAINRQGRLDVRGLATCRRGSIDPSTTREARAICGRALVGEGTFSANVKLPDQSPFPSNGKVLAFNGRMNGRPVILAHIYGTDPAPNSYVLPFVIRKSSGTFGTILEASFPRITGPWGYVTGVNITLSRRFSFRGTRRSYLTAGCPAPPGFGGAFFRLAKTTFAFAGDVKLTSTLNRRCSVRE